MTAGGGGPEALLRRAVAAAVSVAGELGLPTSDPVVLSARGNALVHLRPAPVVARVSSLTAWTRRDPAAWLAREVAVASTAAAVGGPVVRPTDLAPPGTYQVDGMALTLWTHVEVAPRRPSAGEAGAALAALHDAIAGHRGPLPAMAPLQDLVDDALDALARHGDDDLVAALREVHAEVLRELPAAAGPPVVLHGDAHAGNLLGVGDRWLWTDLEETCTGPLDWDLAVLRQSDGLDGAAALRAYAAITGVRVPAADELRPYLRARRLEGAVWALGLGRQGSQRHARIADAMLDDLLPGR